MKTQVSEKEAQKIRTWSIRIHTRAMATQAGITELEKHLQKP
jgi:hypothetical protein